MKTILSVLVILLSYPLGYLLTERVRHPHQFKMRMERWGDAITRKRRHRRTQTNTDEYDINNIKKSNT